MTACECPKSRIKTKRTLGWVLLNNDFSCGRDNHFILKLLYWLVEQPGVSSELINRFKKNIVSRDESEVLRIVY
jgi:hypothetical protein